MVVAMAEHQHLEEPRLLVVVEVLVLQSRPAGQWPGHRAQYVKAEVQRVQRVQRHRNAMVQV